MRRVAAHVRPAWHRCCAPPSANSRTAGIIRSLDLVQPRPPFKPIGANSGKRVPATARDGRTPPGGLSLRRISVVAVGATLIGDLREPQVDVERELWRLSGSQMATQVLLAGLLDGLYALGEEGRGIVLNAFAYAESAASIGSLDLGAEQPLDHLQALLGALEDLRKATIGSNPGFAEKQP